MFLLSSISVSIFFFLLKLDLTIQISSPEDPTYYAAVVEFAPEMTGSAKTMLRSNLERMRNIIESDETNDLDIIVFPEAVLNTREYPTYLPDPEDKISPCEIPNYDHFLTELSCTVRSRNVYAVFNLVEKVDCVKGSNDCNSDGLKFFNTNVAMDRSGHIISRYRKTHLYRYEWYTFSTKSTPEIAMFSTDFGVTFGHFICFDMLFYEPSMSLLKTHNITDIIYPTYWFSELPFLTAVQLQEGWSFANDVNLLAADGSNPAGQNTGSGIYAGRFGRLEAAIYQEPTTKVLKARVPKRNTNSSYTLPPGIVPQFVPSLETNRLTKLSLLRDYNVDIFSTKLLDESFTNVNETLCHKEFCCEFNVQRTLITLSAAHSAYRYRVVIDPSELAVCALFACTSDFLYSCGYIFPDSVRVGNKYYFHSIHVKGRFRKERRSILPSSVDGLLMPLPSTMYEWSEIDGASETAVSFDLKSPKSDLLTFGIWANYYSKEIGTHNLYTSSPNIHSSAAAASLSHLKFQFLIMLIIGCVLKSL